MNSNQALDTYAIDIQLAVGTDIKESAGGVVGASDKGVAVREKLNGIDVGLVAGKGLYRLASTNIPELSKGIASTRDEGVLVSRVKADAHDVAKVVGKLCDALASLNVPLDASHVARRCEDAAVVDEAAAGEVAGVARQFAGDTRGAVALLVEVIYGANVVETTAGDKVARGGVGAGHDPGGAERDGVDLVGGIGVPDDELAVLRGGNEMSAVGRPVHGVNLGEMALEGALGLHELVLGDGLVCLLGNGADCTWQAAVSIGMGINMGDVRREMVNWRGCDGGRGDVTVGDAANSRSSRQDRSQGSSSDRAVEAIGWQDHLRVVSANSSFFLLMRSLRFSASRRACWMRACIASGETSFWPCEFMATGLAAEEFVG